MSALWYPVGCEMFHCGGEVSLHARHYSAAEGAGEEGVFAEAFFHA